jgi:hypothetical protein
MSHYLNGGKVEIMVNEMTEKRYWEINHLSDSSPPKDLTQAIVELFNERTRLMKELAEKDKEIIHLRQMIICLKSGCVEVPNPEFDGPNQDCIPCERLIKTEPPTVEPPLTEKEWTPYADALKIKKPKEK